MSESRIFRSLVVLSLLLMLGLWALPYLEHLWLDSDQTALRNYDGFGAAYPGSFLLYWIVLFSWVVCYLGLMLYARWARLVLLVLISASILSSFLWGFRVQPPYELAMTQSLSVLDGLLLGMAHFGGVRSLFDAGTRAETGV